MKKFITIILMLTLLFSFTACEDDNKKNTLKNSPAVTANSAVSPAMNTPSENICGTQDATETDDNSTALQTAVPTVSNSPTTTMSNTTSNPVSTKAPATSKPTATSANNSKSKSLQIVDLGFDSMYITGNSNIICGKKGSYYGAMNLKGEVVIPFEYDAIGSPTPDGYITAWKIKTKVVDGEEMNTEYGYLFNSSGKNVYKTTLEECYKIYTNEYGDYEYKTFNGEKLLSYSEGVMLTQTQFVNAGVPYSYTLNLRKTDGTIIKAFHDVTGYSGFSDGLMVMSCLNSATVYGGDMKLIIVDKQGKIVKENTDIDEYAVSSIGIANGYFYAYGCPVDSDVIVDMSLSNIYKYCPDDHSTTRCSYVEHFGKSVVFKSSNGFCKLVDISKVPERAVPISVSVAVVSKYDYDSISFNGYVGNTVEYALVSRSGKWGYLSLDGKTEKLYDDAGSFYKGKAIVKSESEIYVINSKFEKISDPLTGYDSVATLGENLYRVTKSGKQYVVVYNP